MEKKENGSWKLDVWDFRALFSLGEGKFSVEDIKERRREILSSPFKRMKYAVLLPNVEVKGRVGRKLPTFLKKLLALPIVLIDAVEYSDEP